MLNKKSLVQRLNEDADIAAEKDDEENATKFRKLATRCKRVRSETALKNIAMKAGYQQIEDFNIRM
jgi:hypothetical protein